MRLRTGTRPSKLALIQVNEFIKDFSGVEFEIIPICTGGDKDKETPLVNMENSDFFTREIEQALLAKEIDIAVHSAKDLEPKMPGDLMPAVFTPSISRYDCLVSNDGLTLDELPSGAVIGTSSNNRRDSISRYRNDLVVKDMRGNVDNRLEQLDEGGFDAIIVAHAALIRLGLEHRIAQIIPMNVIETHPMQGKLAVQIHRENAHLKKLLESGIKG